MLVEASEKRFELVRQTPTLEPPSRNFKDLIGARNAIIVLMPETLPELNQATIEIISFAARSSPKDNHSVFSVIYPFPQFERDNWEFKNDHDKALSEWYQKYLCSLRGVLEERPDDWLMIGNDGVRMPANPQIAIVTFVTAKYSYFEVRKVRSKGSKPNLTVLVNNQVAA